MKDVCKKTIIATGVLPCPPARAPAGLPNRAAVAHAAPRQSRQGWAKGSKEKLSLHLRPLEVWNPFPDHLLILSPAWGMAEQDRDPRGHARLGLRGLAVGKTVAATASASGVWVEMWFSEFGIKAGSFRLCIRYPLLQREALLKDPRGRLGSVSNVPGGQCLPQEGVPRTGGALLSASRSRGPPQLGPFCRAAIFFKNKKGREGGGRKEINVLSLPLGCGWERMVVFV